VQCDNLSQVLVERFDVVFDHAVVVQGRGARLAHSQMLQNLHQMTLEVTALVTM
jgi:hypothetical protein